MTSDKTATIRTIPGLRPGKVMHLITYTQDGQDSGRSIARPEDLAEWRTDLAAAGWTVVDADDTEGGEK